MAVKRLAAIRAADPAPISGLDALLVNQVFFHDDPLRFTDSVNKLCDELELRVKNRTGVFPKGTTRLVISGCPMAVPNWKVPVLVESSKAVIVGEESCVGERGSRWLTEVKGNTVDEILDSVTDRYFNIDCAVFTPNPSRCRLRERDEEKSPRTRVSSTTACSSASPTSWKAARLKRSWKSRVFRPCGWKLIIARKIPGSSRQGLRHSSSA